MLVLAMVAGVAFADDDEEAKPMTYEKADPPVMGIIYSLVGLLGICVVAFKNPRRSHQE